MTGSVLAVRLFDSFRPGEYLRVVETIAERRGRYSGRRSRAEGRVDVLLACSAGGHLLQLLLLRDAWEGRAHLWVTHNKEDARSLLADETVVFAHGPERV